MTVSYKTILVKANNIKNNVEKKYKLGEPSKWSYYFAKSILDPKKNVKKISFDTAASPVGDYASRQISKNEYFDICKRLVNYVEKHHALPNYIECNSIRIRVRDYTYLLARVITYYETKCHFPNYANLNTKVWTKPTENTNTVYDYFVKTFGKITCIDDALEKIAGHGYGYYYDDKYSNKETIDRMKNRKGVNCTDSCHVYYNLGLKFVKQGKYKKVECLHVKCKSGDGHVRLRFTLPNGEKFYRDPAATLSNGTLGNWCINGSLLGVDSSWFLENLHR